MLAKADIIILGLQNSVNHQWVLTAVAKNGVRKWIE